MTEDGFEPARRELCPDGTCVGLIGADGRCKVCGTVAPSAVADPRMQGLRVEPGAGDEQDLDDERELCPDGSCIGLIGPGGRCSECGRSREGKAPLVAAVTPEGGIEVEEDDDSRELCPDGSCIGLIGPDGRCKVCGTARSALPA